MDDPSQIHRNEFLRSLGRTGMMLGMGGLGIAALRGSKDPSECFNHNYCNSCFVHSACTLPQREDSGNERT